MGASFFRTLIYVVLAEAMLWTCTSINPGHDPTATESPSWQRYIVGPKSGEVRPERIASTKGDVLNPEALLSGTGITTLTRARDGTNTTAPVVVVDFGKTRVGYPQITFAGASANHPGVRLAFSETAQYLTNVSDFTRSYNGDSITNGTDQFAVPSKPTAWTDYHGCDYGNKVCHDGLHGFRYLKISLDSLDSDAPHTESHGEIRIQSVSLNFTGYLGTVETYKGWFECSDDDLNQFWYDASYTNELITDTFRATDVDPRDAASPSLEGKLVLFDGAKRDRDPYVGDLAVSARTAYLTHDEVSIAARNVMADLAEHQRSDGWIPPASINNYTLELFDYTLWWATTSWDYVLYTGDTGFAKSYYGNLVKMLDVWCPSVTNAQGLLSKGLNNTGSYGDYAFLGRTGTVTYYNALYVLALADGAKIARIVDQEGDAGRWEKRAREVTDAINANLWDGNVGAYLDSAVGEIRHGQDGNGIAILAGVANQARAKAALDYLAQNMSRPYGNAFMDNDSLVPGGSQRVYAFISYFEIQARFLTGNAESAIEEIKRLYGWMAGHDPGITFWEGIGSNGSLYEQGFTSAAHGWSTGVLPALTNFLLGAIPTAPGFQTWSVKPRPGKVMWARGQLPTPYGPLYVDWKRSSDNFALVLQINAPGETSGDVSVLVETKMMQVHVDGNLAWNGKHGLRYSAHWQDGFVVLHGIPHGMHTITVTD